MDKLCGKCNKPKKPETIDPNLSSTEWCNCGRPLIYEGDETIRKVTDYMKTCAISIDSETQKILKVDLPSIEGLALFLKVSRETIYDWCSKYSEFSDIVEWVKQNQAKYLMDYGLSGHFNPSISKVILTKHGYIDKQDVTSDGKAIKGNSIIIKDFSNATGD